MGHCWCNKQKKTTVTKSAPKTGPKPAKKWGTVGETKKGHSSSSSTSNVYGSQFGGIPKTDSNRGIKNHNLKKTQSAYTSSYQRPKASSVVSRAAVFGGTKKKTTTTKTFGNKTSDVFNRSPFAKQKSQTTASSSSSIVKSNSGSRLRGSSITAKRGTPDVVRRSLEKHSAVKSVKVKARFSFDAQASDELEIHTGDIVEIVKAEGDWWEGKLKGKQGIFPKSYAGDVFT